MRISILLLVFLFFACNNDDTPATRTFEDTREDFSKIPWEEGRQDVELELPDGSLWLFRVVPPTTLGSTTYPLILDLHGASGGSETAHLHSECYAEPGLASLNAFLLIPNAGNFEWYDFENQEMLFNLLELAKEYWPVNVNQIAVTGFSNGGNASWLLSEQQSATFSAGIPMASSYDTSNPDGTHRKIDTPLYVIHGENDELFPLEITHDWVEGSIEAGSDITFVVADTLSHFRPCDYVSYLQEAAVWLKEDIWNN